LLKEINPTVRRTLNELSVIKHIGEENIVANFDVAFKEAVDHMADWYLEKDEPAGQSGFTLATPAQSK